MNARRNFLKNLVAVSAGILTPNQLALVDDLKIETYKKCPKEKDRILIISFLAKSKREFEKFARAQEKSQTRFSKWRMELEKNQIIVARSTRVFEETNVYCVSYSYEFSDSLELKKFYNALNETSQSLENRKLYRISRITFATSKPSLSTSVG